MIIKEVFHQPWMLGCWRT